LDQFTAGRHSRVRLLVDRPQGGITIDEVATVTREILVHLDVELDFSQQYSLEVPPRALDGRLKRSGTMNGISDGLW